MIRNVFIFCAALLFCACANEQVTIVTTEKPSSRLTFGVSKLKQALEEQHFKVVVQTNNQAVAGVTITVTEDPTGTLPKEGYTLEATGKTITIKGNDPSGALYGCIELINHLKEHQKLPTKLTLVDQPEMVLRGTCIGVQKPYYLPGRTVYEYPYTPETFPWLYDKALWIEYLDMLVANKMNSLYLWNGHPFASLVKLKEYPFAVEVDDKTFQMNEEIFTFLTEEADKRGIWVIQMFYNILLSKPFAEHYGLKTQDRSRPITPLIADYTRKSIAAFIEKYPNVGLLVCLGEAMDTYEDDVEWFTNTIIPGVQDGLKALGGAHASSQPPIVLRAHDTNPQMVMQAALPLYKNLYTMHKYNGESLTTYEPRGPWSKIHTDLSSLGSVHISNVHILANLEPFRFGSPDFIQKCVLAMHNIHGANAIHLYPQASYWDYPYTADKTTVRLKEIERNWIWYQAWARYAWKADRNRDEEINYWGKQLGDLYDCGDALGKQIVEAYEQSGEIAPKLLRKFGITEGNRQTLLLGMFMSQLVNPEKWKVYPGFHESCGPEGEMLIQYMTKEWNKEPHKGETPPQLIDQAVAHGDAAVAAIDKASPHVKKNQAEFNRLKNDMYCYQAFANFFSEKVKAAMLILQYAHSNELTNLDQAATHVAQSVRHFEQLVALTKDTYLYANSMQTAQRRIPIGGDEGTNKTWEELLPHYQAELANLQKNISFLKNNGDATQQANQLLVPLSIKLIHNAPSYAPSKGALIFSDKDYTMGIWSNQLANMKPLRLNMQKQIDEGTTLLIDSKTATSVLIGYFNTDRKEFAKPPTLETNASANEYGQADVKIANAFDVPGRGSVNIHTFTFPAGKHTLNLGKGGLIVLGAIDAKHQLKAHNAGCGGEGEASKVDWLFY